MCGHTTWEWRSPRCNQTMAKKEMTVDLYINSAAKDSRPIMEELRKIILATIPEAEEVISWNVPVYNFHGVLAGYSVSKGHVTFGVDVLRSQDREELENSGYKTGKKTIQIRFNQEVPTEIIKRLLQAQAKTNKSKK